MKKKFKAVKERLEQDPKFQEAAKSIKPKKTVWGVLGIILFFFVPELVTYIWQDELINWAHLHSIIEPLEMQRWLFKMLEEMFASGVSWVNLTFGSLLLLWLFKSK